MIILPDSQEEYNKATAMLENYGIVSDDYDNYYSPGCKIIVLSNEYHTQ